jgi:hypothetical protein
MSSLSRFYNNASTPDASVVHRAVGLFSVESSASDPHLLHLIVTIGATRVLWERQFGDIADCDAVLDRIKSGALDLAFYGRVTMVFGPKAITVAVDRIVADARKERLRQTEAEAKRRRDAEIINLYAPDTKRGYKLELQRKSDDHAEWSVRYDRASERDRLCDWLRWQQPRFGAFLEHAAAHGSEALARMLIDEMFETERRVKKEGRGAGGLRPLRMWRGD